MKPKMMSRAAMDYLFFHILGNHEASHQGILQLAEKQLATDDEVADLIRKNSERLIARIREFKVHEKIFGIFFALLLGYMQMTGEDLEMRRTARRTGRRKHKNENVITL